MTATKETPVSLDPKTLISTELFDQIVTRLADREGLRREHAERCMVQALAFLKACADNPNARLAPPFEVDLAWHTFILHTKEYAEFCENLAGRFLHHRPADGMEDDGAMIRATADIIALGGMPVDHELWGVEGTGCHNTCSGCDNSVGDG